MKTAEYRHNGETKTATLTEKADQFDQISIKGVRCFLKCNTYHRAYISGLNKSGEWVELGNTDICYGYGDHYLVTAGDWLIENGYLTAEDGYALAGWQVRGALNIEHHSEDVKRKRDM